VNGTRLIVDVAVADATAPSYRRPPPRHPSHADEPQPCKGTAPSGARGKRRRRRRRGNSAGGPHDPPLPPPPRSIVCDRASSPCEDDKVPPPLRSRCG
jgi:hypothetical protein